MNLYPKLLEDINSLVFYNDKEFSVIIVNDSSTDKVQVNLSNTENIKSIKIINMKENKGHARCNAAGLKYIFENEEFDYVIPMDGDGEDRPEEIKKFIEFIKYDSSRPIVGEEELKDQRVLCLDYFIVSIN